MVFRTRFFGLELIAVFIWILGFCHIWEKPALPFELYDTMTIGSPDSTVSTILRVGDTLKIVDSIHINSRKQTEFILDKHAVGDTVVIRVMGTLSPEPYNAEVTLKRFHTPLYFVIIILSSGILFAMAYIVRSRRPIGKEVDLFHAFCLGMGCLIMSTAGHYTMPMGIGYLVSAVFYGAFSFAPVFLLMFSRVFPNDRSAVTSQFHPLLVRIAASMAVLLTISFTVAATNTSLTIFKIHTILFYISQVWFAGIVILTGVSFYFAYKAVIQESERRKILWITTGASITALLYIGLLLFPRLFSETTFVPTATSFLLMTIMPISMAIALVRYRIMDITTLISRSILTIILSALILLLYALVFTTALKLHGSLTPQITFIVTVTMMTISLVFFTRTKKLVREFVDKTFFTMNYRLHTVRQAMATQLSLAEVTGDLGRILMNYISGVLPIERIAVYVYEDSILKVITESNVDTLTQFGADLSFVHRLKTEKKPIGLSEFIEPEAEITDEEQLNSLQLALVVPILTQSNDFLGCIAVGQKKSGTRFTAEDYDIIAGAALEFAKGLERLAILRQMSTRQLEAVRAEELSRMKSFFVSGVTHELKTPLTAIRMFAEMLRTRAEGVKAQEYLDIIEGESARLSRMIDTVLDFAQVERGVKEYSKNPAELNSIVRNVLSVMRYEIEKEGFIVEKHFATNELLFTADADAIAEAVMNLISNAMKYSKQEHSITIVTFQKNGFVCMSVEDKGIGIPSESFNEIFKSFVRLKDKTAQRVGGAGLGLALVKHIAEGHGGRVEVESKVNRGSKFTLLFAADGKE